MDMYGCRFSDILPSFSDAICRMFSSIPSPFPEHIRVWSERGLTGLGLDLVWTKQGDGAKIKWQFFCSTGNQSCDIFIEVWLQ